MGTASTALCVAPAMSTLTGAWSSPPPADGSVRAIVTVTVASCGGPFWLPPDGAVATVPMLVTVAAAVVWPAGSEMVAASPTLTSDSSAALSCTITGCCVRVACSPGVPGGANNPTAGPPAGTRVAPGQ